MIRACKQDHFLSEEAICPLCGGPTSKQWSGFLAVLDPAKSDLAEAMNISKSGNYALKVR
ncbi:MAG: transcription elongation factor subunit Spt4 [Thermoplasmatota archaeon]